MADVPPETSGLSGAAADNSIPSDFIWPHHVRRLARYGIALPLAVIFIGSAFYRKWGDRELMQWAIVSGFWFIAGTILTGACIIRDALRHDR
jgi:hypothetical protein